jgi:hypothetical protein
VRSTTGRSNQRPTVEQFYWRTHWPEAPSEDEFRTHRRRYGGEGIAEVAGCYEMKPAFKEAKRLERSEAKRNRRSSAELKAEVLELHGRGLVPAAIADVLNISDRRVKAQVAKAA